MPPPPASSFLPDVAEPTRAFATDRLAGAADAATEVVIIATASAPPVRALSFIYISALNKQNCRNAAIAPWFPY